MRTAIVDCGSNTFNLLIAEATREGWTAIFRNKLPVKLGSGGYESGRILETRFIRGLDALLTYRHAIDNFGVQKVYAFATSALRDAANGAEFIHKADQVAGIQIDLIDGNREAELIFAGASLAFPMTQEHVLVMDIGGGSTEFIIGNKDGIVWKHSYQLGVSRLFDMIQPQDRLTREDQSRFMAILENELGALREALKQYPCKTLIGSSGSFDTLLDLFRHAAEDVDISLKPDVCNEIPLSAFPAIVDWLVNSSLNERLKHAAIPAIRAELMPLSALMVKHVLDMNGFRKLWQCDYALKEGAMQELWKTADWPVDAVEGEKPEDFLEG